jgi:hypothetical protein
MDRAAGKRWAASAHLLETFLRGLELAETAAKEAQRIGKLPEVELEKALTNAHKLDILNTSQWGRPVRTAMARSWLRLSIVVAMASTNKPTKNIIQNISTVAVNRVRAVAAPASARPRHSLSVMIETFASRATSSSGSPRNRPLNVHPRECSSLPRHKPRASSMELRAAARKNPQAIDPRALLAGPQ